MTGHQNTSHTTADFFDIHIRGTSGECQLFPRFVRRVELAGDIAYEQPSKSRMPPKPRIKSVQNLHEYFGGNEPAKSYLPASAGEAHKNNAPGREIFPARRVFFP
ncbi:MAG: hypothetical protein Q8T11_17730 [Elusimicrobiota bacterium]|nr:hypothetical protein [Elusimicrobiota bacterium]